MDYWETTSEREMILDCRKSTKDKRTESWTDKKERKFWKGFALAGFCVVLLWLWRHSIIVC